MPKRHSRPVNDFIVTSFAWDLEKERTHRRAGFPEVPREVLARRFWQYVHFLQQHGFTTHEIVRSLDNISEETVVRNSDLTDSGFYFIQRFHGRWISRTYKDKGEQKEKAFLEKWYESFQQPVA
jgi:hypothetical protein